MKNILTIAIIACLAVGGWKFYNYCANFSASDAPAKPASEVAPANPAQLGGMPASLDPVLEQARQRGAKGLREFLAAHGKSISDPKLASIELDYVALVSMTDAVEARRVFTKVKERTPASSPLYNQIQQMQKTYE